MRSQPRGKGHQSGTTFFKHDHNSSCLTRCTDIQIQIYRSVASLFVTHNTHHSYGWKGPGKDCGKNETEWTRKADFPLSCEKHAKLNTQSWIVEGRIPSAEHCLVRGTQSWVHKAEVFWAIIPEGGNLKRSWLLMSWNKIPLPQNVSTSDTLSRSNFIPIIVCWCITCLCVRCLKTVTSLQIGACFVLYN